MRRFVVSTFALVAAFAQAQDAPRPEDPAPLDTPPPVRASAAAQSAALTPELAPADAPDSRGLSDAHMPDAVPAPDFATPKATAGTEPAASPAPTAATNDAAPANPSAPTGAETALSTPSRPAGTPSDVELHGLNLPTDSWAVDDELDNDEIDAFEGSGLFKDPGSNAQATELFKSAEVQLESHEYSAAERSLTDGVEMLEADVGRYDAQLIEPLTMLGEALAGQGHYPASIDTYERAVHIARVNDGLHTPQQAAIIYKEAESLAAMGEVDRANDRHEYAYEMLLRNYGPDSVELVPGMYKLANWYSQHNNIFSARQLYQYAARALGQAYGLEDTRLIPALQGVAKTYRQERFPPYQSSEHEGVTISTGGGGPVMPSRGPMRPSVNQFSDGERALQQIVRIQEVNPEATVRDISVAILDLADWNLMFEKWERANTLYEFAYKILSQEGQADPEQLTTYFGQPRPLYLPLPDGPSAPSNLAVVPTEGYVQLTYNVTDRGYVQNLHTTASEPEGLMDYKVRRAMRVARFRPQLVDGLPVESSNLVYRHRFEYYPKPEEVTAVGEEPAEPGPEDGADAS